MFMKEKAKNYFLLMLLCSICWVVTSCSSDDKPAVEDKTFSHVKAVFGIKAEGETTQCFNINGEWACNGEKMAMPPLKISADQRYVPVTSKFLPTTYSLALNATPNENFVPEKGKKYDAKLYFTYDIQVIDSNGSILIEKEGKTDVINMEGIRTDKLETIARRLSKNYQFVVKQVADGSYEITQE